MWHYLDKSHDIVKMKVGRLSAEEEIECVAAVRDERTRLPILRRLRIHHGVAPKLLDVQTVRSVLYRRAPRRVHEPVPRW